MRWRFEKYVSFYWVWSFILWAAGVTEGELYAAAAVGTHDWSVGSMRLIWGCLWVCLDRSDSGNAVLSGRGRRELEVGDVTSVSAQPLRVTFPSGSNSRLVCFQYDQLAHFTLQVYTWRSQLFLFPRVLNIGIQEGLYGDVLAGLVYWL